MRGPASAGRVARKSLPTPPIAMRRARLAWTPRDARRAIAPRPRCTFVRVARDYMTRSNGLMGEERGTWRSDVTLAAGPVFHLR